MIKENFNRMVSYTELKENKSVVLKLEVDARTYSASGKKYVEPYEF